MNAISQYQFGNHPVRIAMRGDEPWFVAKDVCDALGYANSRGALADHLDADERGVASADTPGGQQKMQIINESGLYALVLRSRKPEARKFAKWVTGEVLPSIRKTGRYSVQPALPNACITAAQAGELSALIAERFPDGRDRPYAWGRFNNHFRIARYRELPAARFAEACAYIGSMQPRALPALANTAASRIDAAYKMASHVAAVAAQAVFKAALSDDADDITYKYGRWLFCMDWNGTDPAPYVKRVDNDAMIVSLAKLPRYLADPGLLATSKELADISAACCRRLAQRMANPPAAPARRLSS